MHSDLYFDQYNYSQLLHCNHYSTLFISLVHSSACLNLHFQSIYDCQSDIVIVNWQWAYEHILTMSWQCIPTIWTCLLVVFRLLEATAVDSRQNPPIGGSKPEVVFRSGSLCLRQAQSVVLTFWHTRDRSEKLLLICCRHCGKCWESASPTWKSRNSSKNSDRRTGNRSETPPLVMIHHVGKQLKTTGPTSPDLGRSV